MGISDLIASFLQDSLDTAENGVLEVQRSELAQRFNGMVVALKRNQEQLVENQRELNEAQIRMLQAQLNPHFLCNTLDTMKWISKTLMMHVINSLGSSVDLASARAILSNLVQSGALERDMGQTILTAVGDKALSRVPRESRDAVRADILRQVLILQV